MKRNKSQSHRRGAAVRIAGAIAAIPALLASCATMESRAVRYVESLPEPNEMGSLITEDDIADLPPVVRRYFEHAQVVGKPRIDHFSFVMKGRIRRGPEEPWMDLVSRQYNLITRPSRIYYIKAPGTPMSGIDSYLAGEGRMHIKLYNLIPIGDVSGPEMSQSALVTFLNDLIICPLGYFSLPVEWEQLSDREARVSLTDRGMTVSAVITFDGEGRIVNWESDDRFAEVDGRQVPDRWSTPMHEYGEVNGLRVPIVGSGIHDYEGGTRYVYVELEEIGNLSWERRGLPGAE